MSDITQERMEGLGPAEQIMQTLVNFGDHLWHGRPGTVRPNGGGVPLWTYINRENRAAAQAGELGELRDPGMFPEAVRDVYRKVLDVYQMDNELCARWASWAFQKNHQDLKVIFAALMLVQDHAGAPVMEDGEVAFYDNDYREVGEAIILHYLKGDKRALNPKHVLRVYEVLTDPEVVRMNREAGFGRSGRNAPTGRYNKSLERWLRYRERNPQLLEGLVREGWTATVKRMARRCGYKPDSSRFFQMLRWKQTQAAGGHRGVGLDLEFETDNWENLDELQICQKIVEKRLSYKAATSKLPTSIGITPAIMAALIEGGGLSDADMIIFTPTLEELGLLRDDEIKARWDQARGRVDNQRARNIAQRVRSQSTRDQLEEAADDALREEVAEAAANLTVLFMIDISSSMSDSLENAKQLLAKFVQGFPPEDLFVTVFSSAGRRVNFRSHTQAGVKHALDQFRAGGGTDYSSGIRALRQSGVVVPEGNDCLVFTVGDQNPDSAGHDGSRGAARMVAELERGGYDPIGFCHLHVGRRGCVMEKTAEVMGKSFIEMDAPQFEDVYQLQRTLRSALEAAPRVRSAGPSLLEQIFSTELLVRPY